MFCVLDSSELITLLNTLRSYFSLFFAASTRRVTTTMKYVAFLLKTDF